MTTILSRGGMCSARYIAGKEEFSIGAGRGMTSLIPKGSKVSEAFPAAEILLSIDPRHVRYAPYTEREETDSSIILRAPYLSVGNGSSRAMEISDCARFQAWMEYNKGAIDGSLDKLLLDKRLRGIVPTSLIYDRERDIFLLGDFILCKEQAIEDDLAAFRSGVQKYLGTLGPTINPPPNAMMI